MRIAYCIPGLGPSGGMRVILEHTQRLQSRGHDVDIFTSNFGETGWFGDFAVPILSRSERAKRGRYDVSVATGHDTVPWAADVPAERHVWFLQMAEELFHPEDSPRRRADIASYKKAAELGYRVLTLNWWLAEHVGRMTGPYSDVSKNRDTWIALIRNGTNFDHFFPDPLPPGERQYVLIEGDARNGAKDVDHLAWKAGLDLREEWNIELRGFAGTAPPWARELDHFTFRPTVKEMRQLYSSAMFLLKASRFEGRSLSPLEAMACGTTVVRGIKRGDPDCKHYVNCLRSPYELFLLHFNADFLLGAPNLRAKMGSQAYDYSQRAHNWEDVITDLEGHLGR